MSALVLCRECYSWAEPVGDVCPVCSEELDLSRPDPTPQDLRDVIGTVERCLGEVTTPRKLLPDRGLLYVTSGGLFFLPHDVARQTIEPVEWTAGSSLLWSAAAAVWSPLAIAGALLRLRTAGPREVVVPVPRHVTEGDGEAAADFLMDDPGAFFLRRRSVRLVRRTWRGWLVECGNRRPVRFRPSDPVTFAAVLQEGCRSNWTSALMT